MDNLLSFFLISRQGSYKLIESDEQWQLIQEQRNASQPRSGGHHRSASAHSKKDGQNNQKSTSPNAYSSSAGNIIMPDIGVGGGRRSGYVNSGAETETEMISVSSMKRTRRRR